MIDPETQQMPTQLPLPAGFLEPGQPRSLPEEVLISAETRQEPVADTAVDELIRHFRRVECRRAIAHKAFAGRLTRLGRWLESLAPRNREQSTVAFWPRISVVVPVQELDLLPYDTITSLLSQTYPDLEVIIVSPFDVTEIERAFEGHDTPIIPLSMSDDSGLVTAVRLGFARASGEVLCWMMPGTTVLPGVLGHVGKHFRAVDADAALAMDVIGETLGWRFALEAALHPSGLFFSRLACDIVNGLDPALPETSCPEAIAVSLAKRITAVAPVRYLPIHAAVVQRQTDAETDDASSGMDLLPANGEKPALWFFPDSASTVPEQNVRAAVAPSPSPIDGSSPERFLFASPDTRFGTPGLHDVWYHAASHCTTAAPGVTRSEVRRLAAQQPPLSERRIIEPEADAASPWRDWRFGSKFLGLALDHPLPGWLLDRWPLKHLIGWTDRTGQEIERITAGLLPPSSKKLPAAPLHVLEVGCHSGEILDHLHRLGWTTHGTEINVAAAEAARAKGHKIWAGAPDDILQTVPVEERFDLVFMGHVIERQADALGLVQRAARLLKPKGLLVIATPNLDSAQISLFGPTWAHWHPPFHRTILSRRTLNIMAEASGLRLLRCRSWSHPYWSWLSVRLNRAGLAGIVPNGIVPDSETRSAVETLILASRLFCDWRGRGDYLFAALSPDNRV